MASCFEANHWDGAARTGTLRVPSGATVDTPALLPVVDPRRLTIDPATFDRYGVEGLITNAYIIHGENGLRERAIEEGLHELLDFEGVIMTDSGSFQLAEYGEIDVTSEEILAFQHEIGSDIATPVDIPTAPDADRNTAERDIETTTERLEAAATLDTEGMLVSGPVQGATYTDLRRQAARNARATDLDVFPVGGVVPLLNGYRFDDAIEVTLAAKAGLGPAAPVHLFGVGHPMLFALAAAAGCDLFDSAAYALYARDGRYLTPRGTLHLEDLTVFPCECPICVEHTPSQLRRADVDDRDRWLAAHNLYVSVGEIRRVRQAIQAGRLFELLETRARAHPRVLDGYRTLLGATDALERHDPARKSTFFYVSPESADRPEVARHHQRLTRLADHLGNPTLLVEPPIESETNAGAIAAGARSGPFDVPDPTESIDRRDPAAVLAVTPDVTAEAYASVWLVRPPFGPFPPALARTDPLSAELPTGMDRRAYEVAAAGIARLSELTDASLTLAHRGWPAVALDEVPDAVSRIDLAAGEQ